MRFRILRIGAGTGTSPPASREARRRGCTCPVRENRAGGGWDVSDDDTRKGFWIDEDCDTHRACLSSD
jgi:hypothetical protein